MQSRGDSGAPVISNPNLNLVFLSAELNPAGKCWPVVVGRLQLCY